MLSTDRPRSCVCSWSWGCGQCHPNRTTESWQGGPKKNQGIIPEERTDPKEAEIGGTHENALARLP